MVSSSSGAWCGVFVGIPRHLKPTVSQHTGLGLSQLLKNIGKASNGMPSKKNAIKGSQPLTTATQYRVKTVWIAGVPTYQTNAAHGSNKPETLLHLSPLVNQTVLVTCKPHAGHKVTTRTMCGNPRRAWALCRVSVAAAAVDGRSGRRWRSRPGQRPKGITTRPPSNLETLPAPHTNILRNAAMGPPVDTAGQGNYLSSSASSVGSFQPKNLKSSCKSPNTA